MAERGHDTGTGRFPLRLLVIGYTTGALAALIVHLLAGGLLAAILTFWLGGAVATLAWAAILLGIGARRTAPRPLQRRCDDNVQIKETVLAYARSNQGGHL